MGAQGPLTGLLGDKCPDVCVVPRRAVSPGMGSKAISVLAVALHDNDAKVRATAANALSRSALKGKVSHSALDRVPQGFGR